MISTPPFKQFQFQSQQQQQQQKIIFKQLATTSFMSHKSKVIIIINNIINTRLLSGDEFINFIFRGNNSLKFIINFNREIY